MQIIKRMPIPTYEIECQECGSVIHFRASESQRDMIACPVCGVIVWTMTARKLEGHADPPGEPGPRGVSFRINLNDNIKVKLTEYGKNIYRSQFDDLNRTLKRKGVPLCSRPEPDIDAEGYTKMQMWCFMELFGPHIGLGKQNFIEPLEVVCETQ